MKKLVTSGLTWPKWYFVALAVPTFYMPLSYIVLVIWTICGMFGGGGCAPPVWMMNTIHLALYVTVALWPIYLAWLVFSKILSWREKGFWLFIVVLLNIVGMPMFYVFMIRRHLGIEGRVGGQDERELGSFLETCGLTKDSLSADQISVLHSYCRKRRFAKYGVAPMILVSCLAFYTALVFVPERCVREYSGNTPTRVVVIDSAENTKKEIAPDPETKRLHVQNIMMMGAMAGMTAAMGFFALVQAISLVTGDWHRKAFIEYLKVAKREHSTNE